MVKAKYNAPKVTDGISVEICKDSHRDLASTPRTEASTPESGEFKTYNIGDSGGRIDHNAKPSSKDNSCAERNLQRHYSQTDTHIQLLDRNGDLNEVAGSQSMLSQELIDHEHDQNDNDRSDDNASSYILGDLGLPEGSQSKSSIGIAKRLGLLTQTQEEEDDDEEEESMGKGERESTQDDKKSDELIQPVILATSGPMPHEKKKKHDVAKKKTPNDASSPESDSSKKVVEQVPLSGLELLTQVGTANLVSSRENEGFGSLLDAVAKITEQEESGELSMNWRVSPTAAVSSTAAAANAATTTKSKMQSKKRKVAPSLPTTRHLSASKQRKSEMQKLKEKLRREKIQQENERAQAVAKKAAIIAERTISDPVIAKKLLLSMALARENPRSVPQILPGKGHVVQEGFFWAHYPPLEFVLKKHMAEYYELSTHQCQSKQQQAFNNYMVDIVKDVAEGQKWEFADSFCDKSLRDRIRCYYKTHIQNAKKRLRTMVRNPTKRANARHLCDHVDLIEEHRVEKARTESKKNSIHSDRSDEIIV